MGLLTAILASICLLACLRVDFRQKALEDELSELRLRVIRLQDSIDAAEPDDGAQPEKRRGVLSFVIFLVILTVSGAGFVYARYGGAGKKEFWEFVSYVLPSIAGLIAGFGIFYRGRRRAEAFFWISGALLSLGIAAFIGSKPDGLLVFVSSTALCVVLFAATLLAIAWRRRGRFWPVTAGEWTETVSYIVLLGLSLVVVAIGFAAGEMEKHLMFWTEYPRLARLVTWLAQWRPR